MLENEVDAFFSIASRRQAHDRHVVIRLLAGPSAFADTEQTKGDAAAAVDMRQHVAPIDLLTGLVDVETTVLSELAMQLGHRGPHGVQVKACVDHAQEIALGVVQGRNLVRHRFEYAERLFLPLGRNPSWSLFGRAWIAGA